MILFDAHVHIQEGVSISSFLTNAERNFSRELNTTWPGKPATYYLMLSEAKQLNIFGQLKEQVNLKGDLVVGKWRITDTNEKESLLATNEDQSDICLYLVAGRQIVTAEKLEILALATTIKIPDGSKLNETVEVIRKHNGLAVLPWGVGKWMGKRRKIVESFLSTSSPEGLFVGDSGLRPVFWSTPRLFVIAAELGIRTLPGSDPLPLPGEELRVGSYGAAIKGQCPDNLPVAGLKTLLTDERQPLIPFGRRQRTFRFFSNQVALRLNRDKKL